MKAIVKPSYISGTITAPTSKSYFQRAIAGALLSKGTTNIFFREYCNDTIAALNIIKTLGAEIEKIKNGISVKGGFNPKDNILDCHESGLCIRMFTPIAALLSVNMTLIGSGSLLLRPQSVIIDSIRPFGVTVLSESNYPPIKIKGPLSSGNVVVDGSLSSQVISGLLMALPLVDGDSNLMIKDMVSHHYIDMTLDIMMRYGINIQKKDSNSYLISGNQEYISCNYNVEGDWSSAAFLIVASLIKGNISIKGLNADSLQADSTILDLLSDQKYDISIFKNEIKIGSGNLSAFEFDATNSPDLFPPLVSLAACSEGVSKIKGVHRLKFKESNRAEALIEEFSKLGITIDIKNDTMFVTGGKITPFEVSSHNDHRIAMSLTIAGLSSSGPVIIDGVESIEKSYPGFFSDMKKLGAEINIKE